MAGVGSSTRRHSRLAPYLMIAPALAYLAVIFVVPFCSLLRTSDVHRERQPVRAHVDVLLGRRQFVDVFRLYHDQILRSFGYAITATVVCLVLAYPLAYVIAFKSGRYKTLLLGMVILPFFVTFLIRTLAWVTILADDGIVVSVLGHLGLLPSEGRLLPPAGR